MSFFNWFKGKKEMDKENNVIKFPEPKAIPPVPPVRPVPPPEPKAKEYYRVGRTDTGMTTLTMLGDGGFSVTLSMNETACEQLIKMIRATYE